MLKDEKEKQVEWAFRVYGKLKNQKRFRPMDLKNGRFVVNLIYASCFPESTINAVIEDLQKNNPTYDFEKRSI